MCPSRFVLHAALFAAIPLSIVRAQNTALTEPIVTVVQKPVPSPSGDPHDYVSYARYYWPDPSKPDGLPYVSHDGKHNEEQVKKGDEPHLFKMTGTVHRLTHEWTRTHDAKYAQRAGDWLRAWFLAPATRMNTGLEYAQVRLGHQNNHGSQSGVLDARALEPLVADITLLHGSPGLTAEDEQALHAWFSAHLDWLLTSKNGRAEHAARNNHGSWFLVQAIAVARFSGRDDVARQLGDEDRKRIAWQFKPDGSQPEELRRVDGLGYSSFNLQAQLKVCELVRPLGIDLIDYRPASGAGILQGLSYLKPYNASPQSWPGHQHAPIKPGFLDPLLAAAAQLQADSHPKG
jgi:hypothetical protein